ncbi:MAG: Gfo/Idh/MocA family oxidoreductase [Vicinamibacterales bacterium]
MARLRAVVIGCGRMGAGNTSRLEQTIPDGWLPLSHTEALIATGEVELVGLCDTSERQLIDRGAHYGVKILETDYRLLIERVRPDIVTVATRTPGRAEIVRHACHHGVKGIYAEKPLENSLQAGEEALVAAREHGVVLFYGVNRRYHSTFRQARALVHAGAIGEIRHVNVDCGHSQLLWTHPHSVDLLLQFSGSPVAPTHAWGLLDDSSTAILSNRKIDSDPIVEHAVFRFENGVIGTVSRAPGWNLRVSGSKGTLVVHGDGSRIEIDGPSGPYFLDRRVVQVSGQEGATVIAMRELIHHVRSASPPVQETFIEDGLRMLLACAWSHLQGNVLVRLRDVPLDLTITGRFRDTYA